MIFVVHYHETIETYFKENIIIIPSKQQRVCRFVDASRKRIQGLLHLHEGFLFGTSLIE